MRSLFIFKRQISIIFLFIFSLLFLNPINVRAADGETIWAKSTVSSTDELTFYGAVADSEGNSYAAGVIQAAEYNFGNDVTLSTTLNNQSLVIVKYNSSGVAQWAKSGISSLYQSNFYDVAVDSEGNAYAVGDFISSPSEPHDLGDGVTIAGGYSGGNAIIVKYNSSGVVQWAKSTTTSAGVSSFRDIYIDGNGNIYVVGSIRGTNTFDFGNSITTAGGYSNDNGVIIKYNSSGNAQWASSTAVGSGSLTQFYAITEDGQGNIYAGGIIYGNTASTGFGNSVTTTGGYGGNNALIVKYNSSGVAQWAKTTEAGSLKATKFNNFDTDSDGNIYATGVIYGSLAVNFGNDITLIGQYSFENGFLIKYNSSGVPQWAKAALSGAPDSSHFAGIAIDQSGDIYVGGDIVGTDSYDFGNDVTISGLYGGDILLIKYNSSGTPQWAKTVTTGPDESTFYDLYINQEGYIYGSGEIYSTSTYEFGNSVTLTPGWDTWNPLLVKYESDSIIESISESSPSPNPTASPISSIQAVTSQAQSCNDPSVQNIPNLFQINSKNNGTSATIYFSPLSETNEYFISFSTNPNAEEHGASVTLLKEGVQSYMINYLKPNNTYYFKVRGQNGCSTGGWSNIMKVRTNGEVYYKNSTINIFKSLSFTKTKPTSIYSSQSTPKPLLTAKPSPSVSIQDTSEQKQINKHCFLWWCW